MIASLKIKHCHGQILLEYDYSAEAVYCKYYIVYCPCINDTHTYHSVT